MAFGNRWHHFDDCDRVLAQHCVAQLAGHWDQSMDLFATELHRAPSSIVTDTGSSVMITMSIPSAALASPEILAWSCTSVADLQTGAPAVPHIQSAPRSPAAVSGLALLFQISMLRSNGKVSLGVNVVVRVQTAEI